jgi:hypothetical protein
MRRVGYLAALGGGAGAVAAPSLRPPRRLFSHEPALGAVARLPADRGTRGASPSEPPAAPTHAEAVTAAPPASAPAPPARPARRVPEAELPDAGMLSAPTARAEAPAPKPRAAAALAVEIEPPGRARPVEDPGVRDTARPASRVPAQRLEPPPTEPATELRRLTPAPSRPRVEAGEPARARDRAAAPAVPDQAPARAAAAAALEPPHPRPEPELRRPYTPVSSIPVRAASRAPRVHIGTIDVSVVAPAPPPPPQQPRQAAAPAASARASRPNGAGQWFGLAQR